MDLNIFKFHSDLRCGVFSIYIVRFLLQVDEKTTTKHTFRSFYAGSELVVAGRMTSTAAELDSQVLGFCGVEDDGYSRVRDYIVVNYRFIVLHKKSRLSSKNFQQCIENILIMEKVVYSQGGYLIILSVC